MVAFVNLARVDLPETKRHGSLTGYGLRQKRSRDLGLWREERLFGSASAARALRRRNGPTVIAVHRRCDNNAPEGPVSTDKRQKPARAFHIYKYTVKIIITPFTTNSEGANSFFL